MADQGQDGPKEAAHAAPNGEEEDGAMPPPPGPPPQNDGHDSAAMGPPPPTTMANPARPLPRRSVREAARHRRAACLLLMRTHDLARGAAQDTIMVISPALAQVADMHPRYPKRTQMLYHLLRACRTLDHLRVVHGVPASPKQLLPFHAADYLKALQRPSALTPQQLARYGLVDDCFPFRGLWPYCLYVAGATLQAVSALEEGRARTAIAWTGGRHHAGSRHASGYCYVNDVVLALLRLQRRFDRVLYVDIDLHHGDAVQSAFAFSRSVLTLSMHKHERGFFPHTGALDDEGSGGARWHVLNLPLRNGLTDDAFLVLLRHALAELRATYAPDCIVLQCGADGLAGDPHRAFNLTHQAYVGAVRAVQSVEVPLLVLGGGGYNAADTARAWAHATCALAGAPPLPRRVPENDFFEEFAPSFSTHTSPPTGAENQNDAAFVRRLAEACSERVSRLPAHSTAPASEGARRAESGPSAPARPRPARAGAPRVTRRKRRRKDGTDTEAGGDDGEFGAFDLLAPAAAPADPAEGEAGAEEARVGEARPEGGDPGE